MITISLCMIVKNEEDVLERCLSCVKDLVDEIIIVDTGSTDETKKIALKYTDKLFPFNWIDDFSAARNYAFSKASMEYCMWLDADDIIEEWAIEDFLNLKKSLTVDTDIVMMRYNTAFDEQEIPIFWYYRERIIKNNKRYLWQGAVHEVITPSGNLVYTEIAVSHKKLNEGDCNRNLNIYKKMLSAGKLLDARETYYYARELYYHKLYKEALFEFNRFISLKEAWVEDKIETCVMIAKCNWEIGNRESSLQALFKSMEYDSPRAEICCEIGNIFLESNQLEIAIFWYKTALNCNMEIRRGGFVHSDCYNFIPAIQLCVCYDKLGKLHEAEEYNEIAGRYKPNSPAFLYNKEYFSTIKK